MTNYQRDNETMIQVRPLEYVTQEYLQLPEIWAEPVAPSIQTDPRAIELHRIAALIRADYLEEAWNA